MHLEFCMRVYQMQINAGRYFIHGHPKGATSWRERSVERLAKTDGVITIDIDMCAFGMTAEDEKEPGKVKKAMATMTNLPHVAWRINRRCTNNHRRVHLLNGKAAPAQRFLKKLCRPIAKGIIEQKRQVLTGLYTILRVNEEEDCAAPIVSTTTVGESQPAPSDHRTTVREHRSQAYALQLKHQCHRRKNTSGSKHGTM